MKTAHVWWEGSQVAAIWVQKIRDMFEKKCAINNGWGKIVWFFSRPSSSNRLLLLKVIILFLSAPSAIKKLSRLCSQSQALSSFSAAKEAWSFVSWYFNTQAAIGRHLQAASKRWRGYRTKGNVTEKNLAVVVEGVSIPSMIYICASRQFWQHVASPDLFFLAPWAGLPDCQHPFPKRILLRSELGYSQSIEGTRVSLKYVCYSVNKAFLGLDANLSQLLSGSNFWCICVWLLGLYELLTMTERSWDLG